MESAHDKALGMDKVDCKPDKVNRISFRDSCTPSKASKATKHLPTPAKVKVKRQAKEIEFLQAELRRLQFENEKLKSQSTSPQNETVSPKHERSLSFNPSVDIVNASATLKNTTLQDKVSLVRSQRSATPYKSTGTKASRFSLKAKEMETGVHVQVMKAKATMQVQDPKKTKMIMKCDNSNHDQIEFHHFDPNQVEHKNGNQHQHQKRSGKKSKKVVAEYVQNHTDP